MYRTCKTSTVHTGSPEDLSTEPLTYWNYLYGLWNISAQYACTCTCTCTHAHVRVCLHVHVYLFYDGEESLRESKVRIFSGQLVGHLEVVLLTTGHILVRICTHVHVHRKSDCLGCAVCCFALLVCLTLLASFFLPSYLSLTSQLAAL